MDRQESVFLYHTHCDECGSSDANSVYDDGHTHCFSCKTTKKGLDDLKPQQTNTDVTFITGDIKELPKRKIDYDTAQKFNYQIGSWFGRPCHIANYYDKDKKLVAQKLRYPDKTFQWLGDPRQATLFGQHLWRDKGKMVIVTEGEIDALSVSKINQNKFPVVSIKTGAAGAKKIFKKNLNGLKVLNLLCLCLTKTNMDKKQQ
jgi:twinkle protein